MADIAEVLQRAQSLMERLEGLLPHPLREPQAARYDAFRYVRQGYGAQLEPVLRVAHCELDDLLEIQPQKQRLLQNTEQFVRGLPCNHVLLSGARGTGKSSLVRACLSRFSEQGLRLIEVDKTDLVHLRDITHAVAARPERFVVFCDDLSFEGDEPGYKALKSVLDGTVSAHASNVCIYATSNRRHLMPEFMKDNLTGSRSEAAELHPSEAMEEKISLSERFGLWLSFYPFSQEEYLAIVDKALEGLGLGSGQVSQARQQALVFALERGSRSGRVALQFARHHAGLIALEDLRK
jgi:predicted AAA+ superfamily ATPase